MKPLDGKMVYLSGPIEKDTSGIDWRPKVRETLQTKYNINVFDPFIDPKQDKVKELNAAKEQQDFDEIARIAADFVSKDLTEVDRCHFLIAHLPPNTPTVGTIHEIINAINRKIPTLIVCSGGKTSVSSWIYGILKNKHQWYIHGNWDSLFNYLDEVNENKHIGDNRWRYVYGII